MKIKDLITELAKHDPNADVHLCSGTGFVRPDFLVSCIDMVAYYEELDDMDPDDPLYDNPWPDPPACDGSCKSHAVVLHFE